MRAQNRHPPVRESPGRVFRFRRRFFEPPDGQRMLDSSRIVPGDRLTHLTYEVR
jgi:hypothetical protein